VVWLWVTGGGLFFIVVFLLFVAVGRTVDEARRLRTSVGEWHELEPVLADVREQARAGWRRDPAR
jgi:hypothetical protein